MENVSNCRRAWSWEGVTECAERRIAEGPCSDVESQDIERVPFARRCDGRVSIRDLRSRGGHSDVESRTTWPGRFQIAQRCDQWIVACHGLSLCGKNALKPFL